MQKVRQHKSKTDKNSAINHQKPKLKKAKSFEHLQMVEKQPGIPASFEVQFSALPPGQGYFSTPVGMKFPGN